MQHIAFRNSRTPYALPMVLMCLVIGSKVLPAEDIAVRNVLIRLIDQVEVPARATGALSAVNVSEGAIVTEGDLLAQIDDTESKLDLEQAQLELAIAEQLASDSVAVRSAEKAYRFAYDDYGRVARAKKSQDGSVSESELDQARLKAEQAGLEIEHTKNDLKSARLRQKLASSKVSLANRKVEVKRIISPVGGTVVRVLHHRGEWVEPGDTIFRIVRTDRLRAEGYLDLQDLRPDLVGKRARLTVESNIESKDSFQGIVVFVSPELEPNNNQVRVWAEFDNSDGKLQPGLRANMSIDVE